MNANAIAYQVILEWPKLLDLSKNCTIFICLLLQNSVEVVAINCNDVFSKKCVFHFCFKYLVYLNLILLLPGKISYCSVVLSTTYFA